MGNLLASFKKGLASWRSRSKWILEWLRKNNRGHQNSSVEWVKFRLIEAAARGTTDRVLSARLAAHHAIVTYRASGHASCIASSAPEAMHLLDEVMQAGHFGLAKLMLEEFHAQWPESEPLRRLEVMMHGPGQGDHFFDDQGADFQVLTRPSAETTFIAFGGRRHRFGVSFGQLHYAWMSAIPANVIYLRDLNDKLFLTGVRSLGDLESTLQALSKELATLGTRNAVFMGASGGVFGALYYTVRLHGQLALCFAGPVDLDTLGDSPHQALHSELKQLNARGLLPWPSLRNLLAGSSAKVRFFYGAANIFDAKQAQSLVGLPNVTLEPLEGYSRHCVIDGLAEHKKFAEILMSAALTTKAPVRIALGGAKPPKSREPTASPGSHLKAQIAPRRYPQL